jgi:ribosome-interacting GTPase 1
MLREVVKLVNEAVEEGHERGVSLFMENLEEDLAKEHIFEEYNGVDTVMVKLFEEAGVGVEGSETLEEMDEDKVDQMLKDLDA